jgi:hypothetical protein
MATFDTDVDVDDMLWSMSSYEKQEMADALYDEGIIPKQLGRDVAEAEDRIPETNLELELHNILNTIWSNRLFLNNDDIQTLTQLSKKGL